MARSTEQQLRKRVARTCRKQVLAAEAEEEQDALEEESTAKRDEDEENESAINDDYGAGRGRHDGWDHLEEGNGNAGGDGSREDAKDGGHEHDDTRNAFDTRKVESVTRQVDTSAAAQRPTRKDHSGKHAGLYERAQRRPSCRPRKAPTGRPRAPRGARRSAPTGRRSKEPRSATRAPQSEEGQREGSG